MYLFVNKEVKFYSASPNYDSGDGSLSSYGQRPIDENTFADVREKLAQQAAEKPAPQTAADVFFESGVESFDKGNYGKAVI